MRIFVVRERASGLLHYYRSRARLFPRTHPSHSLSRGYANPISGQQRLPNGRTSLAALRPILDSGFRTAPMNMTSFHPANGYKIYFPNHSEMRCCADFPCGYSNAAHAVCGSRLCEIRLLKGCLPGHQGSRPQTVTAPPSLDYPSHRQYTILQAQYYLLKRDE